MLHLLDSPSPTPFFFQEAALAAHSRLEESQKAQGNLEDTLQQLHSALVELQDQKIKLESQVELLQIQSQQLERHTR